MARYLSPEWFEDVNAASRRGGPSADGVDGPRLTLQQIVTGGPDGEVRYWVRARSGGVEAGLGEATTPDATIIQSYETAVAVLMGELSVQTAFMTGRVRLTGDMGALIENQAALHGVDAALTEVRSRTTFA